MAIRMRPFDFAAPPNRPPESYGSRASNNQKRCSEMAQEFFRNGVQRARERNQRQVELDRLLRYADADSSKPMWDQAGLMEARYLRFLRTQESPSNYRPIRTIGKGAFGEVKLVRKVQDGRVYALKRLMKSEMISRDQLPRVRAERDALVESKSEWVVKLYTTFQDTQSLYMLMEYLPGGDLMTMLIRHQVLSEDVTRFYMAEMVMAIEAIHRMGYIHRDIKPDNVLFDISGHIKLADFGLSTGFRRRHESMYYQELLNKPPPADSSGDRYRNNLPANIDEISLTVSNRAQINEWRRSRRLLAYSAVGTPDYIAPEIIAAQSYSFEIDWWSLGTILYECLVGWAPFASEKPQDTYVKILNWQRTLTFPDDIHLSYNAVHLVRSLVCNSEVRLGRIGSFELKNHPFFTGVDFNNLRCLPAPFLPSLASEIDTSNFPVEDLPQDDGSGVGANKGSDTNGGSSRAISVEDASTPEMTLPFMGYTFKRFESTFN